MRFCELVRKAWHSLAAASSWSSLVLSDCVFFSKGGVVWRSHLILADYIQVSQFDRLLQQRSRHLPLAGHDLDITHGEILLRAPLDRPWCPAMISAQTIDHLSSIHTNDGSAAGPLPKAERDICLLTTFARFDTWHFPGNSHLHLTCTNPAGQPRLDYRQPGSGSGTQSKLFPVEHVAFGEQGHYDLSSTLVSECKPHANRPAY